MTEGSQQELIRMWQRRKEKKWVVITKRKNGNDEKDVRKRKKREERRGEVEGIRWRPFLFWFAFGKNGDGERDRWKRGRWREIGWRGWKKLQKNEEREKEREREAETDTATVTVKVNDKCGEKMEQKKEEKARAISKSLRQKWSQARRRRLAVRKKMCEAHHSHTDHIFPAERHRPSCLRRRRGREGACWSRNQPCNFKMLSSMFRIFKKGGEEKEITRKTSPRKHLPGLRKWAQRGKASNKRTVKGRMHDAGMGSGERSL